MAFYMQNIRQAQVSTKALGQGFLNLQTLPVCRRRLKSTKPSFIQWNSSLELSGRTYIPPISNFHRAEQSLRSGALFLDLSRRTYVPTSNFHLSAVTLSSVTQMKNTKPSSIQWNSCLELSGRKNIPCTSDFHHLAEMTLNSNAAYFINLGAFLVEPTVTNNEILERMGIKVHYDNPLRATEIIKETSSVNNVASKVTETEETH